MKNDSAVGYEVTIPEEPVESPWASRLESNQVEILSMDMN